jgi:uncharacterized damage-inducible protein DinB
VEITTIRPFLEYFSKVRERTLRVARCVPPDKLDWSCAPGRFTPGDLLRPIAVTERYLFAENVRGRPSRYTSHGRELGESYDQVLLLMDDLHKQSMEIFARLTDEDLRKKCPTPGGVQITTWKWLRSLAEHEIHHRGQIYFYLALLGVPAPPLYGLTSEQVRVRGAS